MDKYYVSERNDPLCIQSFILFEYDCVCLAAEGEATELKNFQGMCYNSHLVCKSRYL